MTAPLIAAKLRPPAHRAGLVPRDRLVAALDATRARVVLVSAPPGYGKSTLLAEWLAPSGVHAGWLALDVADNDPVRFLRYLRAAAMTASGRPEVSGDADPDALLAETLEALDGAEADGGAEAPSSAGALARRVLVLDDYHLIESRQIHEALAFLVERLPDGATIAIATRADPPLPISRLRARGELLEFRAVDLRFTAADAEALLRGRVGRHLPDAAARVLTERTEGWPAALQLAALALEGSPDAEAAVERFGAGHRFVLDYVADEVLAGLDSEMHAFLLRTSVLGRLTGPLCDAVTGLAGGADRLRRIEDANLLAIPLDDERRSYRYHALFADILHARLVASEPGFEPELHRRAAAWLEEHGEPDDAFDHAVRGGDLPRATRIFRERWPGLAHAGELATLRRWLDSLPAATVRSDAQLSAAYAWLLILTGEVEGVRDRLDDADRALAGPDVLPVDRLVVPTQVGSVRSRLALVEGDPEGAVRHAREAIDAVPDSLPEPERTLFRGDATLMLGHALRSSGDLDGAGEAYARALPLLRTAGNWIAAGYCVTSLARLELAAGRAGDAVAVCRGALDEPGASPLGALSAVRVALAEAYLALGWGEQASEEARRAAEAARRAGQAATLRDAEAVLARIPAAAPPDRGHREPVTSLVEPLTPRELEVLQLVARGRSNRQIAAELFVTLGTAKVHVHSICQKLDAANRVEAIVRARELGLLE